jgi:general stress protein CsbA
MGCMAKRYLMFSVIAFAVFVVCALLIAFAHAEISRSVYGTYAVLGITAVSMFAWPVLLARSFQEWTRPRRR